MCLTETLTDRMVAQPILFVKVSITMVNFDGDFDRHVDNGVTCK